MLTGDGDDDSCRRRFDGEGVVGLSIELSRLCLEVGGVDGGGSLSVMGDGVGALPALNSNMGRRLVPRRILSASLSDRLPGIDTLGSGVSSISTFSDEG